MIRWLYLMSVVLVASCILYVPRVPYVRMVLQDMFAPHVLPERLPIVQYLKSFGATYRGVIGVVDIAFDLTDQYFADLVHPGSARFASLDHRSPEQKRADPKYNHGNIVARIVNKILPHASFVCVRLAYHEAPRDRRDLHPSVCAEDMHNMGVRIVVVSLEFSRRAWVLEFSKRATELGMIVVYAAANKRMPIEKLPAVDEIVRFSESNPGCVLWVGGDIVPATRHKISGYPSTGDVVPWCFSAAGVNVDCGAGKYTGSSCAAPIVGAVLALLMELFPGATPRGLIKILREISKTPIGVTVPCVWYYNEFTQDRLAEMHHIKIND